MQYIVRDIPNHWSVAKLYFPQLAVEDCTIYEIVFGQLSKKQKIKVELSIDKDKIKKSMELYHADGSGKLTRIKYLIKEEKLCFKTDKIGVYVIVEQKKMVSFFSRLTYSTNTILSRLV